MIIKTLTRPKTIARLLLALLLAPFVVLHLWLISVILALPIMIGLMNADDYYLRGMYEKAEACTRFVDVCVDFMLWPLSRWKKLLIVAGDPPQG